MSRHGPFGQSYTHPLHDVTVTPAHAPHLAQQRWQYIHSPSMTLPAPPPHSTFGPTTLTVQTYSLHDVAATPPHPLHTGPNNDASPYVPPSWRYRHTPTPPNIGPTTMRVRSHVRFVRNPHGLLHFWLVMFQQEWSHGVHCGAVRPANQAKKLPQPRCQKLLRLKRDSPNTR